MSIIYNNGNVLTTMRSLSLSMYLQGEHGLCGQRDLDSSLFFFFSFIFLTYLSYMPKDKFRNSLSSQSCENGTREHTERVEPRLGMYLSPKNPPCSQFSKAHIHFRAHGITQVAILLLPQGHLRNGKIP